MTWKEKMMGSLARGYYTKENEGKELDAVLIDAMANEIEPLITSLLKKQRENCYKNYLHGFSDDKDWDKNAILNAPDE